MTILTEAELRNRIRQPRKGETLTVPPGTRFSPAAADFIKHWQILVVYADAVAAEPSPEPEPPPATTARPAWDKPGTFPVRLEGELPRCVSCGMPVKPKPEHLTQVDAGHFAPKNTPRIRFRGKLDTLHAVCMLVAARAAAVNLPQLAEYLHTLAAYCREILSAEYNNREVAPIALAGLDEAALRQATHDPKTALGIEHIVPGPDDHEILHWLNFLRCLAREAEIAALDAVAPVPGYTLLHPSLAQAVNRLSSAVYYLELLFKAGKLTWKMPL
ncbi:MAG: hypothetical protein N2383_06940 [Caldilineales bacterium]|nr:hypothetical protein [Caldilineales bacterium]